MKRNARWICFFFLAALSVRGEDNNGKGLIAWWPFDEGEGAVAYNTLDHAQLSGRIVNATWVDGVKGKALKFSGKSAVLVPPHESLDFSDACTLTAWINIDENAPEGVYEIINKGQERGPGYRFSYYRGNEERKSGLSFRTGEGYGKPIWGAATAYLHRKTSIVPGRWYHVAAVFDGEKYRIFVDGKEEVCKDIKRNITVKKSNDLTIGNYITRRAYGFHGLIDEVKIWNRALTPLEIIEEIHSKLICR